MALTENSAWNDFINQHRWATLTTLRATGQPVSSVIAYACDADTLIVSTPGTTFKRSSIERDPRVNICVFSNAEPFNFVAIEGIARVETKRLEDLTRLVFANLTDTPYQEPNEAFRPKKIEAMDPFVRDTAYGLIDAFIDDGRCDWVKQFAIPLPLIIIARQMGAPAEDIWRIKEWTDAFANRIGLMQGESEEIRSVELEIEAQHYFQPVFERLRKEPDDSLLSELVNRVIPEWGRPLSNNELHAEMMGDTFVGGSETTTNAISYGMKLLIEQPAVWAKLKSDPERYLRTFCEEVVRLESPVQSLFRAASEDIEMSGVTIPKGSIVNMRFAAANRDGREFDNPEELDLERSKPGRHLGFGSGTHHCLGAPLARREMYWAFRALIDRIEAMRFVAGANDFEVVPNVLLRAMRELHIEFDALPEDARRSPADLVESSGASERGDET